MAATFDQRVRREVLEQEDRLDTFYSELAAALVAILTRFAGLDGTIPIERWRVVRERIEAETRSRFAGETGMVYSSGTGIVTPQSAFMTTLWTGVRAATVTAVERQAAAMRRRMDIETERRLLIPPPGMPGLGNYAPPTRRLFEDGRDLRARTIRAGDETARGVGLLLWDRLAQFQPVSAMTADLTAYLTPGRPLRTGNRPEGSTGTHWGMRLARTALLGQLAMAGTASARLNPFARSFTVRARPECCERCARIADGGPYALDDVQHLPPFHPNCGCQAVFQYGSAGVASGWTPIAGALLVSMLLRDDGEGR